MELKNYAALLNALSDETRLRILNLLATGELCVCDLMCVLKEPQSKISRHLAFLRRAGLVETRKKGLWMYYRLAQPDSKTSAALLNSLKEARSEVVQLKKDLKEFERCKGSLVACCKP